MSVVPVRFQAHQSIEQIKKGNELAPNPAKL